MTEPHGKYRTHELFGRLRNLAVEGHARGRSRAGVTAEEILLARLYSYGFRKHVIGAFHATRVALEQRRDSDERVGIAVSRAAESLQDLANAAMDDIADDQRALLSTFHFYCEHIQRVLAALDRGCELSGDRELMQVRDLFRGHMEDVSMSNGLVLARDTHAPPQCGFVVPGLGITIVPLVYGDRHSWNLAWLDGERSDVPFHRHHEGAEIHLGYAPLHGYTVLGDCKAEVTEGYAMPIPPGLRHGYTNLGPDAHHVPFIFGSRTCGGWGVFLDVEPQPKELEQLKVQPVSSPALNGTIHLERELAAAAARRFPVRYCLIPASATDRSQSGGLELSVSRVTERISALQFDRFVAVSVVRGSGVVRIAGQETTVGSRDHFGIPANAKAEIRAVGSEPLVILDAVLKSGVR